MASRLARILDALLSPLWIGIRRRQRNLALQRPPLTRQEFVEDIAASGGHRAAAELLWEKLIELRFDHDLTPYPDDNVVEVFAMDPEDKDDDLISAVCDSLGLEQPTQALVDGFGGIADTPRQIATLIGLCPPKSRER